MPASELGGRKPELTNIDDGFEGAPVGASARDFPPYRETSNAGTSKPAQHQNAQTSLRYSSQAEGGAAKVAQVLSTGKPEGTALSAWSWSYPAERRRVRRALSEVMVRVPLALQLPVSLTVVEQFSPILA